MCEAGDQLRAHDAGSDSRSAWNAASAALRTSFDGSRSDSNARVWVVIGVVVVVVWWCESGDSGWNCDRSEPANHA